MDLKERFVQRLTGFAKQIDEKLSAEEKQELAEAFNDLTLEIRNYFDALPDKLQKSTNELMKRGWFICFFDDNFDDYHQKESALFGKTTAEKNELLEQYFELKISEIEELIT
ncbi:hypothetical protein A6E13_19080 [Aliivibrio fischeri]|uniref:hypothetical protein n=1 Tax=Aliivibrio fischeri TaxID=668 RepID=UPI00080DED53|nr:hypothetical protein [Aliivibrio fischeri]OCH29967.1 hypothetical protein A6E13_19080 [Aliivibrio fischeri]